MKFTKNDIESLSTNYELLDISSYGRIENIRKSLEDAGIKDHLKNPYGKTALARRVGFAVYSYDNMVHHGVRGHSYYEVLFRLTIELNASLNYILDQQVTSMEFQSKERMVIKTIAKIDKLPREALMRVWEHFGYEAVRGVLDG